MLTPVNGAGSLPANHRACILDTGFRGQLTKVNYKGGYDFP
jgi:hypothetical protein